MKNYLLLIFVLLVSCTIIAQQNTSIPIDSKVRIGKLDNGLTYYILQNKTPENRAYFHFAQRVGSMQEEENQMGLEHFLEHMAYNITENFPNNTLLNYKEDIHSDFLNILNTITEKDVQKFTKDLLIHGNIATFVMMPKETVKTEIKHLI